MAARAMRTSQEMAGKERARKVLAKPSTQDFLTFMVEDVWPVVQLATSARPPVRQEWKLVVWADRDSAHTSREAKEAFQGHGWILCVAMPGDEALRNMVYREDAVRDRYRTLRAELSEPGEEEEEVMGRVRAHYQGKFREREGMNKVRGYLGARIVA